jgi:short-subunit dehydrogenase
MNGKSNAFTLITGASTGLGKEIALECARRGRSVILVALPGRDLPGLAEQLERRYGIEAIAVEVDLTAPGVVRGLVQEVLSRHAIDALINNAGIGGTAEVALAEVDYLDAMIMLNVRSTVMLTRLLLPELLRHPQAFILNVSSAAAFRPMAYKAVYAASKSFIKNFSQALREELRGGPVSVSVISPGPMITNFSVARRIAKQGLIVKLSLMSAKDVAHLAVEGMLAKKALMVPGWLNKLYYTLMKIIPYNWGIRLIAKGTRRELREAPQRHAVVVAAREQSRM